MSKSTQFFATSDDLRELFEIVEGKTQLQFVQAGRFDSLMQTIFHNSKDLPKLGIASHDSSAICDTYLVSTEGLQIFPRQLSSAPFFVFDQLRNPKTVSFKPGGLWEGEMLIRGSVGTASSYPDATRLMKIFNAALRNKFINVRGIFVGAEAERLWRQGKRLTGAKQSPVDFDLAP